MVWRRMKTLGMTMAFLTAAAPASFSLIPGCRAYMFYQTDLFYRDELVVSRLCAFMNLTWIFLFIFKKLV
jgi:hypothetical protein